MANNVMKKGILKIHYTYCCKGLLTCKPQIHRHCTKVLCKGIHRNSHQYHHIAYWLIQMRNNCILTKKIVKSVLSIHLKKNISLCSITYLHSNHHQILPQDNALRYIHRIFLRYIFLYRDILHFHHKPYLLIHDNHIDILVYEIK